MSMQSQLSKRALLTALKKNLGIITKSCQQVDIERQTHYRWLREDPEYKKEYEEIADIALDYAEGQLFKQIEEGEVTSTIFYLKCKGKSRGYIERTEVDQNNSGKLQIEILRADAKNTTTPEEPASGTSENIT